MTILAFGLAVIGLLVANAGALILFKEGYENTACLVLGLAIEASILLGMMSKGAMGA